MEIFEMKIKELLVDMSSEYFKEHGYAPTYVVVGLEAYQQLRRLWLEQMIANEGIPTRVMGMTIVKCPSFSGGYMMGE